VHVKVDEADVLENARHETLLNEWRAYCHDSCP
jgi:hypothetical protein